MKHLGGLFIEKGAKRERALQNIISGQNEFDDN